MDNWLTIEEASEYIGVGKTVLYAFARDRKIPASRIGKKWLFEKKQIDSWIRSNKPIESYFISTDYDIVDNDLLRDPQKDGYSAVYDFFKGNEIKAIVQIPVGCGKTGLASLLPFGISNGRVLIISPNLTIKDGLLENFDVSNRQKCFWRKADVLKDEDMIAGPYACSLDTGNISVCEDSHIVITNIHQLATNVEKWLNKFKDNFFDLIIVDEGHHSAANSWKKVFEKFPKAKVVNMTATPFRGDSQEIEGKLVYRYSFKSATIKGYIKHLKASYVAPSELTFNIKGEKKIYSLKEVLKLKEEDWFSRGVALSEVCNISIVDNSLEKLEKLRETGTKHQLIAVACSIHHAKQIQALYTERGYSVAVIHSKQKKDEQESIKQELKNGNLDCIVQVQMLGEGFDHPKLSVAAIFRPFRSLAPYIQFVGRIMRVVVQNDSTHPDNYGHIVTHVGMNIDQRLKEFKQFESDDKAFWDSVVGGEEPIPPHSVKQGEARKKIQESVFVDNEIIDHLIEEDFVSPEDRLLQEELEKKLEQLGLDVSEAEKIIKKRITTNKLETKEAAEPFSIIPIKEWEARKKLLHEEIKRTAKLLLNNAGLEMAGREMPYKYRKLGIAAQNNFAAAVIMVNQSIKKEIGDNPRQKWKTTEFKMAQDKLPEILNKLVRLIKKQQIEYEKSKKR